MENDCPIEYCFYYGKCEFCRCKRASSSFSAATVKDCRSYRLYIKKEKEIKKSIDDLFNRS